MDALHLPRYLHCLHEFPFGDQWFVADLDTGVVLPTPEPKGAPGVPILPLLMALGADCPCLVSGGFAELAREPVFESRLFLLEKEPTVEHLSEYLHQSLAKRQMPRQPLSFSWEGMVQKMIQVFHECHSVRQRHLSSQGERAMKPLFQYHYVKSEDAVEVAAHLLPDFSNVNFETALKLALEGEISPNEIRVVEKRLGSHELLGHAFFDFSHQTR